MTDWLSNWSYLGIFVCVFLGNFGVPVPEELVLLTAGFLAGRHILELDSLYIVAVLSSVAGDSCVFQSDAPGENVCSDGFPGNRDFRASVIDI